MTDDAVDRAMCATIMWTEGLATTEAWAAAMVEAAGATTVLAMIALARTRNDHGNR